MDEYRTFDYEHNGPWMFAVIECGKELEDGYQLERFVAICTTPEARDAAFRLLSGQCKK